ncbi:putative ribonuclease H-like domain-containing protein [Tanacetum coccineum]
MNYQPVIAGNRTNGYAGSETNSDAGQAGKEKVSDQEYILLPLLHTSSYVPSSSKEAEPNDDASKEATEQPACVEGDKTNDLGSLDQLVKFRDDAKNINNINTASPTINTTDALEDTGIFNDAYDDRDEGAEADYNNLERVISVSPIPSTRANKDHPKDQIIGEVYSAIQTRRMIKLNQRRIKAIRLFLAYASFMDFTVYQLDVKSAFLYGTIEEEVYVSQPPGFMDPEFPNRVYKVEKALYGLHQALRAWYETLSTSLLENGFKRGTIDKTLFIKKIKNGILLVQVYVDDIIFGSTKKSLNIE